MFKGISTAGCESEEVHTQQEAQLARTLNRLTHIKITAAKEKGLYPDGGGLYLQVTPTGARSWVFRYKKNGRARGMGLGPVYDVPLAEARDLAAEARRMLREGLDPLEERHAKHEQARLEAAMAVTFDQAVEAYLEAHEPSWRNPKHRQQWRNTLATYCSPILGSMPVQKIETAHVLKVIEPIWATKTETASRVRGRIETILDWARARNYRTGENPARWRGHLANVLPPRSRVQKVRHHPAMPHHEVAAFMAELAAKTNIAASALRFVILTAVRTNEALQATWSEFDLEKRVWLIPAERMKSGREHRVPLSPQAYEIIKDLHSIRHGNYVFPGQRFGRPLSEMSMLMLLRAMGREDITVHGFRSSFRDWAAEATNFPREVAEAALAHVVGDKTEAAYRRSDLFVKRAKLMEAWGSYATKLRPASAEVLHLQDHRQTPLSA